MCASGRLARIVPDPRICRILYSAMKASHCCLKAPAEYIWLIFALSAASIGPFA
jgi:hypothetical protein